MGLEGTCNDCVQSTVMQLSVAIQPAVMSHTPSEQVLDDTVMFQHFSSSQMSHQ